MVNIPQCALSLIFFFATNPSPKNIEYLLISACFAGSIEVTGPVFAADFISV